MESKETELNFEQFPLYSREIPEIKANEDIEMTVNNDDSAIHVGLIRVNALAASSVIQAGRNERIQSEARIKRINWVVPEEKTSDQKQQPDGKN
ncbi:hypothetical protein SK3146_06726 [Paenibacillus konkukensis]|uniref:Uncharacterized protein n=1 Tax=Paenibacillus konkukensis TaxID=2020716 RepID=A0ABY4RXM0_9BACL|nr:hypothetical protein SK3146_06726 [Paenibacillus konkukensis]